MMITFYYIPSSTRQTANPVKPYTGQVMEFCTTYTFISVVDWLYRGYTGHENIDEFSLIYMNARLYDPLLGRMLSPDNVLAHPFSTQDYNPYNYAANNPMCYVDPDGYMLAIPFFAISFVGVYLSNVVNGILHDNQIKHSWEMAGKATNDFGNAFMINLGDGVAVGINPLALGVQVNYQKQFGNNTVNANAGICFFGGYAGLGYGFDDGTTSFGVSSGYGSNNNYSIGAYYKYNGYGLGYTWNHYSDFKNLGSQNTGTLSLFFNHNSFSLENVFFGDKGDRWRTQAAEIQFGNFSIGSFINTNDPDKNQIDDGSGRPNLIGKLNKINLGSWSNGQVYESPLYISYTVNGATSRIGYNHIMIQDRTQNFVHRNIVHTRHFLNNDSFHTGLYYTGFYDNQYLGLWRN